ncbi:preprotein translocase subunit SecB [Natronocella acetinitrilica]|uniref:Protein-export protein SecB n=1 Tax=Natronocella acetinitrilica TaxID=414046 RepID=A0AAE3K9X8_9GAMM|nr:protein-export chaperone SecB [Natronocella acetinitrilica]MCP1673355.1 preprotein translocase subunit SecB [Natronocella acetinitrilica]
MAEENGAAGAAGEQKSGQQFAIQKIYLKDSSFETPNSPEVFRGEWKPKVSVDLTSETRKLDDNTFETVLKVTVTAKLEEKTAYLCEVHQAGVFTLSGFSGETLEALLGSYCPANLFPYAREVVSDLVSKGGFPQMLLGPVNFDALYMQRKQKKAAAQAPGES